MTESKAMDENRELSREETMSALFAHLVMQQSNMALMLMGKTAHPQTGEAVKDLEAARLFIDELEMLEAKTKGNLNKNEEALLKQSLMNLRMAFVEAVESPGSKHETHPTQAGKAATAPEPAQTQESPEESHKKFTKKY